jgi:transcriptional regulator with XRE-family HTH domain
MVDVTASTPSQTRYSVTWKKMATAEFAAYLKERCAERGISLHRLAVQSDLNQIYFYQSVNKNKDNPPPWVLRRIAPILQVSYVELLIQAGYLAPAELAEYQKKR